MKEIRHRVYWMTEGEYDIPESENWINVKWDLTESFGKRLDDILEDMSVNGNFRYVVVTDSANEDENESIRRHFLSNNVLNLKNGGCDPEKLKKQIEWILSDFGKESKNVGDNVFFTSDQHFWHKNIIRYCNRPWNSGKDDKGDLIVEDSDVVNMNQELLKRWNSVVRPESTVWCLGDFCLGPNQQEHISELVKSLNGKINLVMGNHDHHSVEFYYKAGFHRVYDRAVLINGFILLSHSPLEFVKAPFYNVYGHVHDCETYKTWSKDSCCVCVERHDYRPVSLSEIKRKYDEMNCSDGV